MVWWVQGFSHQPWKPLPSLVHLLHITHTQLVLRRKLTPPRHRDRGTGLRPGARNQLLGKRWQSSCDQKKELATEWNHGEQHRSQGLDFSVVLLNQMESHLSSEDKAYELVSPLDCWSQFKFCFLLLTIKCILINKDGPTGEEVHVFLSCSISVNKNRGNVSYLELEINLKMTVVAQ